ncbi:MAG: hypothetical protein Q8941_20180 [Bacteroidota bacterium]|nr:hypothetical protein [Bacteroidota bacterium]
MKRIRIVQAVAILAIAVTITSCGPAREYHSGYYGPRPQANFSLIISSSPGLVVLRDPGGRYYYRDPRGYIYWRGYDNRYYLDRRYISREYHHHEQYNEWRRYHDYDHRRR